MYYWQWIWYAILAFCCFLGCCGGFAGFAYHYQKTRPRRNKVWGGGGHMAGQMAQPMAGGAAGAYDYSPYSQAGSFAGYSATPGTYVAQGGNMGFGPSYY